jgi:3-hydroxyacyl-[acyl-carrier-protein] dehydratase
MSTEVCMAADRETMDHILKSVPQQYPFRFIDNILELDEEHIAGCYRFREDEYFYQGHFPNRPITPGVVLIETMAQTGVVAFGLYLKMMQGSEPAKISRDMISLFTLVEGVEFTGIVHPGEQVIIRGEKVYFRMGNIKAKVRMERENGEMVSCGTLAGMGFSLK